VTTSFSPSSAVAEIRAGLGHPVIDADGHLIEMMPLVGDIVREQGGADVARRFRGFGAPANIRAVLPARVLRGLPAENTLDRMTATLPRLLHARMDALGIDFAMVYPSAGLTLMGTGDHELRQVACRSLNLYYSQIFAGLRDRLEPVAVIPMYSPAEAIVELDHAVGELGLKAVVMSGVVPRERLRDGTETPWIDTLGHASAYDYDPVWKRCEELGVVPTFHGIGYGWGSRASATNYVYNHLGSFAAAQEAVCRSLLMGGAPRRFPAVRFAFLEGGVSWAAQLYCDVLSHFAKRNINAIGVLDPKRVNLAQAMSLLAEFGDREMTDRAERYRRGWQRVIEGPDETDIDEFADSAITTEADIVELFAQQFYFGCEADDPLNALAFDGSLLPGHARLNAMFASDLGHWDVQDANTVLPEAFEAVEHGHITAAQFRDFTFTNAARMFTSMNPSFFAGTVIEAAVRDGLATGSHGHAHHVTKP
jgi:predicted TIM-barrel fold metal-dependent hydrolase